MSSGSWNNRWHNPPPRRSVEGGVAVAKPGKVTTEAALELVAAAEMETDPRILSRGRTYARLGQVVAIQLEEGEFSAEIQGTRAKPYRVRLQRTTISGADRIAADCSCPYGCDYGWCKHAAALAYVAAFLVESQPATTAAWSGRADDAAAAGGTAPAVEVAELTDAELAVLRREAPRLDGNGILAAAAWLVPAPWTTAPGPSSSAFDG